MLTGCLQTILPQQGGALQPNHKLERRLEFAAAVLCLLVQAVVWVASSPHLTPTQHARQAALCTLWAAGGLLDALLPEKLWLRYRQARRCSCIWGQDLPHPVWLLLLHGSPALNSPSRQLMDA